MASAAQLLSLACLLTALLGHATALNTTAAEPSSADPRLLFKFIIISPDSCTSTSGGAGICYSRQDCSSLSGTSDGNCAKGLGVCCTFTRTCGQQTQFQSTTFTNPTFPSAEPASTTSDNCVLTVYPMNNNICQVRLDMGAFTLAQPDVNGLCKDDFMTVTGGSSIVPTICGDNAGQHMYVDVEPGSTGSLKINIDASIAGAKWNIQVTQIECTSTSRAPDGCLQYFTGTSGVVSSFNYLTMTSLATGAPTRQLANQNYGVCIQSQSGYCSVTWEKPTTEGNYFFSMTDDPTALPPTLPGVSLNGDACTTDYVLIPGGQYDDASTTPATTVSKDRFCGTGFPTAVKSSVTPYVLYVVTNNVEPTLDFSNQGFSLKYRANPCTSSG